MLRSRLPPAAGKRGGSSLKPSRTTRPAEATNTSRTGRQRRGAGYRAPRRDSPSEALHSGKRVATDFTDYADRAALSWKSCIWIRVIREIRGYLPTIVRVGQTSLEIKSCHQLQFA